MTDQTVKVMFTTEPNWTRPRRPLKRRIVAAWRVLRAQPELRTEIATFGGGGGGEAQCVAGQCGGYFSH